MGYDRLRGGGGGGVSHPWSKRLFEARRTDKTDRKKNVPKIETPGDTNLKTVIHNDNDDDDGACDNPLEKK